MQRFEPSLQTNAESESFRSNESPAEVGLASGTLIENCRDGGSTLPPDVGSSPERIPVFPGVSTRYGIGASVLSLDPWAIGTVTSTVIALPGATLAAGAWIACALGKLGGRRGGEGGCKPASS